MSGREPDSAEAVEMPEPTVWPFVLAVGVALLALGVATTLVLSAVGFLFFVIGLYGWIGSLLPGKGHLHEPLVEPARRARPVEGVIGRVELLREGMPGYRFRLPEKVHPISSGVKGGIVGGLVMPIPALLYGLLSGHGLWFPINLLAGTVLPIIDELPVEQLEPFRASWLTVAIFIHAVMSVGIGLLYGVIMPTLPRFPGSGVFWGGILMPVIWTWLCHGLMGIVNPALGQHVEWRWFLVSQFVYGIAMAIVVERTEQVYTKPAGSGPEGPNPPGPVEAGA